MTVRNHTLSRQRNIYKNNNKINTYNEKRKYKNNEYILNIKTWVKCMLYAEINVSSTLWSPHVGL